MPNYSNINVTIASGTPALIPPVTDYESVPISSVMRISLAIPFTSFSNTVVDPDITTFVVTPPVGATPVSPLTYSYHYGIPTPDPTNTIVRDLVGNYHIDFDNSTYLAGIWIVSINGDPGAGLTQSDTITACSGDGTTLTYTANNTFSVGQLVNVSGITGSTAGPGFSGVKLVATASSTGFTVADHTVGTAVLASALATNVYDVTKTKIHYTRNILVIGDSTGSPGYGSLIPGPTGATGPTGPTGPAGPTGPSGASPYIGTSSQNPVWLAPVKWVYDSVPPQTIDPYTYDNGISGVGATCTQVTPADGALSIDGGTPALGDRVLFYDWNGNGFASGIYVVSALGDGVIVPWVLTRSSDNDTEATLIQNWAVTVVGTGARFPTGSQAIVSYIDIGVVGTGDVYFSLSTNQSTASGYSSTASGYGSVASGYGSTASGSGSVAYGDGQVVDASLGSSQQHSWVVAGGWTNDATPFPLTNLGGQFCLIRFVDTSGAPVWNKTVHVKGIVLARNYSTPGTDSCWSFESVLRGDGTSAYTWIGGTDPVPVVIAQDSGASTWAVAITIGTDPFPSSAAAIIGTVTGAANTSIGWEWTLEMNEVSG